MARSTLSVRTLDSAGSQFFIMVDAAPHLDGQYAAFGRITDNVEAHRPLIQLPHPRRNRDTPIYGLSIAQSAGKCKLHFCYSRGRITDNVEAAVAVSRTPRSMMNDKPQKPQVIQSIRVDTQGEEYPEPEKK